MSAARRSSAAASICCVRPRRGWRESRSMPRASPRAPTRSTENRSEDMIDVYYWTTPNGHKVTIFLEETGLPYKIIPVNIGKGAQLKRDFLAVSPNNRIPAIVDHDPPGGGAPIPVFES